MKSLVVPIHHRFLTIAIVCFITLGICLAVYLSQHIQNLHQQAAGTNVQVTVDPASNGSVIPTGFIGVSSEPADSPCEQLVLDNQNPTLAENMFKNLGPTTFRFGGDSVEGDSWSTSGNGSCSWSGTVQTPAMVDATVTLLKKVGWRFIWGVNLKNGNPSNDAANAAYVAKSAGSTLIGIEIGNEPNLYGWSYSQYQTKWEAVAAAIQAAGTNIPIVGPAGTDCCSDFYTPFINAESSKIVMGTDHYYPTANSTTFQQLLSPSLMQGTIQSLQPRMQLTHAKNLPYQLGETNAVANVPPANIGDAFGVSLWLLDYAMSLAKMGASGMNVHGWSGDATSIFYSNNTPRPNYYGMLAFHYAAPDGTMLPIQISTGGVNITAYGIRNTNGNLQVVLINKDLSQSASVQINTTQSFGHASDIRLQASSVNATTGITLGGSAVASDGSWNPSTIEPVSVTGANSSITVPAASAAIVTYTNGTTTITPSPTQKISNTPQPTQPHATNTPQPTNSPTQPVSPTNSNFCGRACTSNSDCDQSGVSCGICDPDAQLCTTAITQGITPTTGATPTLTTTPSTVPTNTPIDTPTATLTQSPTTGPTTTGNPSPTGTSTLGPAIGTLSVHFEGIDPQNNPNPHHPQRMVQLFFYRSLDFTQKPTQTLTINASFSPSDPNGSFVNNAIDLSSIPQGSYYVLAKSPEGSLRELLSSQLISIRLGQTIALTGKTNVNPTNLRMGDINNDNSVDLADYNILVDCYGMKTTSSSCKAHNLSDQTKGLFADINDDGVVNGIDYNLLIRNLGNQGY